MNTNVYSVTTNIEAWSSILQDCISRAGPKPSRTAANLHMMDPATLVYNTTLSGPGLFRYKFTVEEKYCYSAVCFYTGAVIECEDAVVITVTDLDYPNHNVIERWYNKNAFMVLSLKL